ncbi:glycosyltransferase [Cellulomonas triticagri]|uniref:Glycosyltransferase n=1 Tax=Cellulomonas triticagri TaxID=2483352 RepID=A0A3M2IV10_9CELL|nr:glycosyltransferase [Cellulomonas triticagri]RMI03500.1 glycosyltransferase [Cellulomonas triticagri]
MSAPATPGTRTPGSSRAPGDGTRRDLVVLSLEPWDEVWRRNQHLVAGLLADDPDLRVLFVEPPVDHLHDLRRGAPVRLGRRLRRLGPDDGAPQDRAWAYRPTKWLPRRLAPGGDDRRARTIARVARRLGMVDPVLWVNDPDGAAVLRRTGWRALYDITDDWLRAVREPAEHERVRAAEQVLVERCAEVVVCSPALARTKGTDRPVTLLTNAVDVDAYRTPAARPADLPDEDYAVYVGTLHPDRLDVEACVQVATRLRAAGARLVLVGPPLLDAMDLTRLEAAGAVVLGARPAALVPGYLQHAGALVVPHVVDDFTDSLDPIKLYEYLAVGRPVVSTPVAGFRDQPAERVTTASAPQLADAVLRVLDRRVPPGPGEAPAEVPRWSDRVQEMQQVLTRVRTTPR